MMAGAKLRELSLALTAVILLTSSPAFAACTSPTGNEGDINYSAVQHVMAYCNGSNWVAMGSSSTTGFGTLTTSDFCTATSGTAIACTTASTGSGNVVLATSPTITTPTFSGTVANGTFSGGTWNGAVIGATYGGTGINNGSNTLTLAGVLSLPAVSQGDIWYGSASGTISALAKNTSATAYLSNTGSSNNPAWAQVSLANGVTGNLPNANLASQTANTVLGALTATTPSGLAMPSCSTGTSALTWTTGTGFGCNSISGGGSGTVTASPQYQIPYYSASGTASTLTGSTTIKTDSGNDLLLTSSSLGIGTATPQGELTVWPGNTVASAAGATLDYIALPAATTTITGTTGITTAKGFNAVSLYRPTYTDSSAVTVTTAATLYIDNAPLAAGAVTITYPLALEVNAGNSYFGGNVGIGTTSPNRTLDINGQVLIEGEGGTDLRTRFIGGKATGATTNGPLYIQYGQSDYTQIGDGTTSANFYVAKGSVGIGTTGPVAKLDVRSGNLNLDYGQYIRFGNEYAPTSEGGNNTWSSGTSNFAYVYWTGSYDAVNFYTPGSQSSSVKMTMLSNGNVGIANTTPSYILDVNGQARFTGGYTTSDRRWKTNIEPIKGGLDTVTKLQGVTFDWRRKEFPNMNFNEGKQIGFIAQDVEKILPAIVSTDKQGYKNLSYESITPVLVEAVKELKADNDNQAVEIKALRADIEQLKAARH